nr:uncharacterized protein LOC109189292 [Ipomoea trifida]
MNVDAAINKLEAAMGLGSVIRDDNGNFIAAWGAQWRGNFTPREAKPVAIREALSWLKAHNMDNVQVDSDSLQVVQSLKSSGGMSSFHMIIEDIKYLLHEFCNLLRIGQERRQVSGRVIEEGDPPVTPPRGHAVIDPSQHRRAVSGRERHDVGAGNGLRASRFHPVFCFVDHVEAAKARVVGRMILFCFIVLC